MAEPRTIFGVVAQEANAATRQVQALAQATTAMATGIPTLPPLPGSTDSLGNSTEGWLGAQGVGGAGGGGGASTGGGGLGLKSSRAGMPARVRGEVVGVYGSDGVSIIPGIADYGPPLVVYALDGVTVLWPNGGGASSLGGGSGAGGRSLASFTPTRGTGAGTTTTAGTPGGVGGTTSRAAGISAGESAIIKAIDSLAGAIRNGPTVGTLSRSRA